MTTATQPLAGTWKSDPIHSTVGFAVKHMVVATFRGSFNDFGVTLDNSGDEPVIYGAVRVASVDVRDEKLNGHLLSPDFFDAERHPEVVFRSTGVDLADDGAATVRGELTIKGITREVVATGTWTPPAETPMGTYVAAIELSTDLDRTQYGMTWNAPLPKGGNILGEKVALNIHLELQQQA